MAVDRKFIGFRLPTFTVTVDAERVRTFAEAIGARSGGIAPDAIPPTFLKVIEGTGNSSRVILDALGVDLMRVMHAEQEFEFVESYRVDDVLTVDRVVKEIYERKQGTLEFIVVESAIRSAKGALVGMGQQSILVRNPDGANRE